jgi:hypothetical protein
MLAGLRGMLVLNYAHAHGGYLASGLGVAWLLQATSPRHFIPFYHRIEFLSLGNFHLNTQ